MNTGWRSVLGKPHVQNGYSFVICLPNILYTVKSNPPAALPLSSCWDCFCGWMAMMYAAHAQENCIISTIDFPWAMSSETRALRPRSTLDHPVLCIDLIPCNISNAPCKPIIQQSLHWLLEAGKVGGHGGTFLLLQRVIVGRLFVHVSIDRGEIEEHLPWFLFSSCPGAVHVSINKT